MGTGPAAAAMNNTNEKTVQRTIANAMKPYHLTEEIYHLQNSFIVFIAENKPLTIKPYNYEKNVRSNNNKFGYTYFL